MDITRRVMLRRLSGVATAGVMWLAARFALQDDILSSNRNAAVPGSSWPTSRSLASRSATSNPATTSPGNGGTNHTHHEQANPTAPSPSNAETVQDESTVDEETTTTAAEEANTTEVPASLELVGPIGPLVVPHGSTATIVGDINLNGDLVVEGVLKGVDTFTLDGNGHQIVVQRGGRLDLTGNRKTAWSRWGGRVEGWRKGDRLTVAPTAPNVYQPTEVVWQGSWGSTSRPPNSSSVSLGDGSTAEPEVVNLSQTVTIRNLSRIMIHDGSGVQALRWLLVEDTGVTGELGAYPIHFHLNANSTQGSIVEGVVVLQGQNHAFVPHGSHGIAFHDCAAVATIGVPFWWDRPEGNQANNSNDITWDRCLALDIRASPADGESIRLAGFWLGAGTNLRCTESVATGVSGDPGSGPRQRSGFHWPENASKTSWDFRNCVAHNNGHNGLFSWQNTSTVHVIQDLVAYNNGVAGINHGAYSNNYHYSGARITGGGLVMHAKSPKDGQLIFENIIADGPLLIAEHNSASPAPTFFRSCRFSSVSYKEGSNGSYVVLEDCAMDPSTFDMTGASPDSVVEIFEGGALVFRWASGAW